MRHFPASQSLPVFAFLSASHFIIVFFALFILYEQVPYLKLAADESKIGRNEGLERLIKYSDVVVIYTGRVFTGLVILFGIDVLVHWLLRSKAFASSVWSLLALSCSVMLLFLVLDAEIAASQRLIGEFALRAQGK